MALALARLETHCPGRAVRAAPGLSQGRGRGVPMARAWPTRPAPTQAIAPHAPYEHTGLYQANNCVTAHQPIAVRSVVYDGCMVAVR